MLQGHDKRLLLSELNERELVNMWLQQDNATAHNGYCEGSGSWSRSLQFFAICHDQQNCAISNFELLSSDKLTVKAMLVKWCLSLTKPSLRFPRAVGATFFVLLS